MKDRYDLEADFRSLYWEINELQLIATPAAIELARIKEVEMTKIEALLGYTPAA